MRIQPIHLILSVALLAPGLHVAQVTAQTQGCKACTSSSSCAISTERGYCSFGCNSLGICSCGDAPCERVIRPVTLAPGDTGNRTIAALDAFSVIDCKGRNELMALVQTPLGVALLRLDPAEWPGRAATRAMPLDAVMPALTGAAGTD